MKAYLAGGVLILAALASLLVYSLVMAPFAFTSQGQQVYLWPDDRITALAVLFKVGLLAVAAKSGNGRLRSLTAAVCLLLSGSILLLFFIFNFGTNAPDGVLPSIFSTGAATAAMNILDGMRFSPIFGLPVQALAWFLATVTSFFALRLRKGARLATLEAGGFASLVLAAYSLCVYLVIPQWAQRAVTGLQYGTFVSWFTNDDLLVSASLALVALMALRLASHRRATLAPAG